GAARRPALRGRRGGGGRSPRTDPAATEPPPQNRAPPFGGRARGARSRDPPDLDPERPPLAAAQGAHRGGGTAGADGGARGAGGDGGDRAGGPGPATGRVPVRGA